MSEDRLLLGVDIGTTGCRLCAVSAHGRVIGAARAHYSPEHPGEGRAEQDAATWWGALCRCARELFARVPADSLAAVAVSGQSAPLLPLDAQGAPLRKAILWQDTRASVQTAQIARNFGRAKVRSITGLPPAAFTIWPKILWLQEREPTVFERAMTFPSTTGYVTWRLCGRHALDRSSAMGYPIELETGRWSRTLCSWANFPTDRIPPILPCGSIVGHVSPQAAAEACLPEGLPVAAGGMDTACAALAVGAHAPGRAFEVTGTSGGFGIVAPRPSAEESLAVSAHLLPDVYINHAPMSAAGASLEWFVRQFCHAERQEAQRRGVSAYEILEEQIDDLPDRPTGLLFLPYLAGERAPVWDPNARGVALGFGLSTTRAELARSIMEGVAYALRQNLDIARRAGLSPDALRSCGGGSASALWCQIKADVMGLPVVAYPPQRDAAYGAALLAGLAAGVLTRDRLDSMLPDEGPTIYEPREEMSALYAQHLERYRQLYPHIRDLF